MKNIDQKMAENLEALLDGKLEGHEEAEVKRLAAANKAYRDHLVYLKGIKLLASLTPGEKAPYGIADRVMNRIMAPKPERSFQWQWSWAPSMAAAAACVMLGLYLGSGKSDPRGNSSRGQREFVPASEDRELTGKESLTQAMNALRSGDTQTARAYLSSLEQSPDFAQLKARGLNMVVVRALLDQEDFLSLEEYLKNHSGKAGTQL